MTTAKETLLAFYASKPDAKKFLYVTLMFIWDERQDRLSQWILSNTATAVDDAGTWALELVSPKEPFFSRYYEKAAVPEVLAGAPCPESGDWSYVVSVKVSGSSESLVEWNKTGQAEGLHEEWGQGKFHYRLHEEEGRVRINSGTKD